MWISADGQVLHDEGYRRWGFNWWEGRGATTIPAALTYQYLNSPRRQSTMAYYIILRLLCEHARLSIRQYEVHFAPTHTFRWSMLFVIICGK